MRRGFDSRMPTKGIIATHCAKNMTILKWKIKTFLQYSSSFIQAYMDIQPDEKYELPIPAWTPH